MVAAAAAVAVIICLLTLPAAVPVPFPRPAAPSATGHQLLTVLPKEAPGCVALVHQDQHHTRGDATGTLMLCAVNGG